MPMSYRKHPLPIPLWVVMFLFVAFCLLSPMVSTASQPPSPRPQRVISLYGGLTETLYALGLGSCIVGVANSDDYPAEVLTKPKVGTHFNPSIEKILSLNPDLVLAKNRRGRTSEALTYLEKAGIGIFTADPHTIDDFFVLVKTLGKIFQYQDKAAGLIKEYERKLEREQRKVATRRQKKKVFFEVRYHDHALIAAGGKSIVNEIIRVAGGINIVESPRQHINYSIEKLLNIQPDIYIVQRGPMNRSPLPAERPLFRDLIAVKKGQVFSVDEKKYSRFGPRTIEAIIELENILYPDSILMEQDGKPGTNPTSR